MPGRVTDIKYYLKVDEIIIIIHNLQTPLKEGTIGSVESILSLTPSSHDDGATLVCRARSQALPAGKDTAVTLSLQCECSRTLGFEPEVLGERRAWDLDFRA